MSEAIFGNLWNNWMFRLSLSSNELFHSNFLQLILTHPAVPDLDGHGGTSDWNRIRDLARWAGLDGEWMDACQATYGGCRVAVYREWKQLDLAVVAIDDKQREIVLFAVELKVKSYPTLEQLEGYLEKMEQHNERPGGFRPRLILLSLAGAPIGADKLEGLSVMDFGQLVAGIAALPPGDPTLAPATAEYVRFCELLHRLGQHWKATITEQLVLHKVLGPEQPYRRFHPIWSKLCAATLCELVRREMRDFPGGGDLVLETVPGYSNGTWSADFLWCARAPRDAGRRKRARLRTLVAKVGIQVEGRTIRFMLNAEHLHTRSGDPRAEVEAALLAAAGTDGLFARLHALHAGTLSETAHAFWERRPGFTHGKAGLPVLGKPAGANRYLLTGYTNNAGFGHADYRLQLDPEASLGTLAALVADALKGGYNEGGVAAFRQVLVEPGVFAQA